MGGQIWARLGGHLEGTPLSLDLIFVDSAKNLCSRIDKRRSSGTVILTLEFVVSGEPLTADSREAKIAQERSSSVSQTL